MKPELRTANVVVAWCDRCASVSSFVADESGSPYGAISWRSVRRKDVLLPGDPTEVVAISRLYRCSGCNRGGVGEISNDKGGANEDPASGAVLRTFYPTSIETATLPKATPRGIRAEFIEAEKCANASAWRGATAMLRSALEKTLVANGYKDGNLKSKLDDAADDGLITNARRRRAHDDVRVLGNEVVHDEWRAVDREEFQLAYGYTQRVIGTSTSTARKS